MFTRSWDGTGASWHERIVDAWGAGEWPRLPGIRGVDDELS